MNKLFRIVLVLLVSFHFVVPADTLLSEYWNDSNEQVSVTKSEAKNGLVKVGEAVYDSAGNIIGYVKDTAGTVVDKAGNVIGKVADTAGKVVDKVGNVLGGLWDWVTGNDD